MILGSPDKKSFPHKMPSREDPLKRPPEKKGPLKPLPDKEKPSDPEMDLPPER